MTESILEISIMEMALRIRRKEISPVEIVQQTLKRIESLSSRLNSFITVMGEQALADARIAEREIQQGNNRGRLHGLPVAIKDIFATRGVRTPAGSKILSKWVPDYDATVVKRLRKAGAVLIGKTNMHEFSYGVTSDNPHFGPVRNPWDTKRIPGGSSGGSGAAVAASLCAAALGSDTGGSIRIPAALQGLVGFKNTQRLTPLDGSIPLSPTLDTSCAITRNVADAVLVHGILAARLPQPLRRPLRALRLGVPSSLLLDGLDTDVARAFEGALRCLAAAGAQLETVDMPLLADLGQLQAGGGFPAAESWAWHRHRLASLEADYDPRVALRIKRGAQIGAADYLDLQRARQDLIARFDEAAQDFDALLSPTVPVTAPPLAPLMADDALFFATNALLLRNPSAINLLDGCALSLPCQAPDAAPVGLMVWAPAMHDDAVLGVSLAIEAVLAGAGG